MIGSKVKAFVGKGLLISSLVVLNTLSGCSCSSEQSVNKGLSKEAIEERDRAEKIEAEYNARILREKAARQAAADAAQKKSQKGPVKTAQTQQEEAASEPREQPRRPESLADWKAADYLSAKQQNDQRLYAAINYLGETGTDDKKAAKSLDILGQLVAVAAEESGYVPSPSDDEGTPRGGANVRFPQAVVAALAVIGTPPARALAERLITGKVADHQLPAIALRALIERPSSQNDDLIMQCLAQSPQPGREAAQAGLRAAALKFVRDQASEALRVKVTKAIIGGGSAGVSLAEVWECVKEPRVENLAAQAILYQSRRLDERSVQELERAFASQSHNALGYLLVRTSKSRVPNADEAATQSNAMLAAKCLWQPGMIAALEQRFRLVERMDRNPGLLMFAAETPDPTVRAALLRTIEKFWEEGPGLLGELERGDGVFDPGLRLALRQLLPKNSGRLAVNGKNSKALAAAREIRQRQEEITKQWKLLCENLVRGMCQRYYQVARSQPMEPGIDDAEALSERLGIKLRPETVVVISHCVDWPDDATKTLAGLKLPPLRFRYARVEHKAQPAKLLAYYRRQLPSCEQQLNEQGAWLEGSKRDNDGRCNQTIDVLITKPNKDSAMLMDQEQPLVVDILVIECPSDGEQSQSTGEERAANDKTTT